MRRLLVYSHDTFGLGNIRRTLAICEHLVEADVDLSILLVTGSPVIHNLRPPARLDYIKLPCLTRSDYES
jgi:predicted glycosyltransferase